jgi:LPS-assembly protein
VARVTYQPNSLLAFTSRFRFDHESFAVQRAELETTASFGRWTTSVLYGSYAPQSEIGFPNWREGLLGTARLKLNPEWVLLGAARYDLVAHKVSQTQIGLGYVDDCLILAVNYITNYVYSGNPVADHAVMMQLTLRTLGGTSVSQGVSGGL